MPVESPVTYISDLVATNPVHTDGLAQADSHLRLIKAAIQATFPNVNGAVTASQSELNNGATPIGGIIMWSGSIASIPANWHLCDGTSGTPDLRDRFVIGAGNSYAVDATGGASSYSNLTSTDGAHTHQSTASSTSSASSSATSNSTSSSDTQGAHSHAGASSGAHALDITEMPIHSHTLNTVGISTGGSNSGIVTTGLTNALPIDTNIQGSGNPHSHSLTIPSDGSHSHNVTTSTTTSVTTSVDTTTTVSTPGSSDSNHSHGFSLSGVLPPFLALAFIQRVS